MVFDIAYNVLIVLIMFCVVVLVSCVVGVLVEYGLFVCVYYLWCV